MTGTAGPLGRESMSFRDKMVKYHAEIERLVYAAEINCKNGDCKGGCPFNHHGMFACNLRNLRDLIGHPVKQDDCSAGGGE